VSVAPERHQSVNSRRDVAFEIEVLGRWDALALSERLIPFHSFLVQHGPERWVVHARSPGWRGEPVDTALAAIDEWRRERAIDAAIRMDEQPPGDS
jgi:hypothetical protein